MTNDTATEIRAKDIDDQTPASKKTEEGTIKNNYG